MKQSLTKFREEGKEYETKGVHISFTKYHYERIVTDTEVFEILNLRLALGFRMNDQLHYLTSINYRSKLKISPK